MPFEAQADGDGQKKRGLLRRWFPAPPHPQLHRQGKAGQHYPVLLQAIGEAVGSLLVSMVLKSVSQSCGSCVIRSPPEIL